MGSTITACLFTSSPPVPSGRIGTSKQTYLLFGVLFPIIMLKLNNVRNNSVYCVMSVPDACKIHEQFEVFIGTMFLVGLSSAQPGHWFAHLCDHIASIEFTSCLDAICTHATRAHTHIRRGIRCKMCMVERNEALLINSLRSKSICMTKVHASPEHSFTSSPNPLHGNAMAKAITSYCLLFRAYLRKYVYVDAIVAYCQMLARDIFHRFSEDCDTKQRHTHSQIDFVCSEYLAKQIVFTKHGGSSKCLLTGNIQSKRCWDRRDRDEESLLSIRSHQMHSQKLAYGEMVEPLLPMVHRAPSESACFHWNS